MARRKQILVIGYGKDHCNQAAYEAAYEVGLCIAKIGAVLVTGGLGGVMEASSQGAKKGGGLVVGIIPQADKGAANDYCDVVVATGIGLARDFLTAYSADAIIVVGGGAGTLIELAAAYHVGTPIITVRGTGGVADQFAGRYIDDRKLGKVLSEGSPDAAVKRAFSLIKT